MPRSSRYALSILCSVVCLFVATIISPYLANSQQAVKPKVAGPKASFSSNALINTFAGNRGQDYGPFGVPATQSGLYLTQGVVSDAAGNIFIAEQAIGTVARVDASTGILTQYAGGTFMYCSPFPSCQNGIAASSAQMGDVWGLAVDATGDLYIADALFSVIWKVTAKTGIITIFAGVGQCPGTCYSGDGGKATQAQLDAPLGVAVDSSGNVYISDTGNAVIREVTASNGIINTLINNGSSAPEQPIQLAFDNSGNLLIADNENSAVELYDTVNHVYSVIAGQGSGCDQQTDQFGDGCLASQAIVPEPWGVAVDGQGNIFIVDPVLDNVRVIDASTGIISLAAGNGTDGYSGDGGPAQDAEFIEPFSAAFDPTGNLYIGDYGNEVIRQVDYSGKTRAMAATPTFSPAPGTYTAAQSVTISDKTAGTVIYYTLDGSTPSTSSPQYGGTIPVTSTTTISAFAVVAGYNPSVVATGTYTINAPKIATTTKLTSSANPGTVGATITFTATVTPGSGAAIPTGDVTSTIDGGTGPSGTLNAQGVVSYSTSTLTAGAHAIVATYSGDADFNASSAALTETIGSTTKTAGTPVISPAAGTYTTAKTITIADATSGATIYYTTNGATPSASSTAYTAAFKIAATTTVKAIAVATGYSQSAVATAVFTIAPTVATPTILPTPGTYTTAKTITMADTTTGAAIYYTIDGTTPTTASTLYSAAFKISKNTTVKAIAAESGDNSSAVASSAYVITLPATAPTFSLAAGTYTATEKVTLTDATSGAAIYFTTDGTTPTTSSTRYASPVVVSKSETIEAIAIASGFIQSPVSSAKYTISPIAATPVIGPAAGTYTTNKTITITDATAGAVIYYTTNGTTPTTASTHYTAAFVITKTSTMKAIAVATGYTQSAAGSETYTLNLPTAAPIISPAAGTYTSAKTISMTDATAGGVIYYTLDGTTPTAASTQYTAAFKVSASTTVKAVAITPGYTLSPVTTAVYTLKIPTATPTFSVAAGTYATARTVALADATAGAVIYYTTNGTVPTTASSVYTAPVAVSTTETIEAIAIAPRDVQSTTALAKYTIQ